MDMHDEIAHMGVVNGLVRGSLPGLMSLCVVRINTNDIEFVEIAEFDFGEIFQFSAEYEVEKLFGLKIGHCFFPVF